MIYQMSKSGGRGYFDVLVPSRGFPTCFSAVVTGIIVVLIAAASSPATFDSYIVQIFVMSIFFFFFFVLSM